MKKSVGKLIAVILITFLVIVLFAFFPGWKKVKQGFIKLFTDEPVYTWKAEEKSEEENGFLDTVADKIKDNVKLVEPKEEESSSEAPSESIAEEKTVELNPVTLIYVIDGDTVIVAEGDTEFKVRFIGLNTEESVASEEYYKENNDWGKLASDFTKETLSGYMDQTIYLEYDQEKFDQYDRTLAYIWLSEDTSDLNNMLNAFILKSGYAETLSMQPNTKYEKEFQLLYENAIKERTGLWADDKFRRFKKN